jgi:hypothetical protein
MTILPPINSQRTIGFHEKYGFALNAKAIVNRNEGQKSNYID